MAASGVHQSVEKVARGGVMADQFLRMPLNRDGEPLRGDLGRFDDTVRGMSDDPEALAGTIDRLVVEAIHFQVRAAQDLGEA